MGILVSTNWWSSITGAALETYLKFMFSYFYLFISGYLWWSLIFGIAPMIWFYPLNELEISGYEAFVVTTLSPIFVGFGPVLHFANSVPGLALLRTLSLVGVASFQAPTTLIRLIILAAGCGTAMLWFCGMIWSRDAKERWASVTERVLSYCSYWLLNLNLVQIPNK